MRSKDNTLIHSDIYLWFREFRRKMLDSSKRKITISPKHFSGTATTV